MLQFNSTFNRKSWFLNYFQMHYASRGVFFTPNIYTRDNITGYSRKISLTENITVMFQHIVKFYCYTAWWIDRGCLHMLKDVKRDLIQQSISSFPDNMFYQVCITTLLIYHDARCSSLFVHQLTMKRVLKGGNPILPP